MKNLNKVGLIDIGLGNVGSIVNMHRYLGIDIKRVTCEKELEEITHLILPGVGSYDYAIKELKEKNLFYGIQNFSEDKQNKILGICLGMQLLLQGSEEGEKKGLGLIQGKVIHFKTTKVPHMGWNIVHGSSFNPFFKENDFYKFYFVHSYYLPIISENTMGITSFEKTKFTSAITNGTNVFGMQFHPEKSHDFGLDVFSKFSRL